ncbi:MAG: Bcr/CflA family drug resistance efflux transporter, partial [Sphingopyxis sp.]
MHNNPSAPPPETSRPLPGQREMVVMMAMVMALNALAIDSMLPALPAIG